jgi:WD40 repeat protein
VLPTPIKIYDSVKGEVLCKLEGHVEEVLCVKTITFEGENYLLSAGQDGKMIKWRMNRDFRYVSIRSTIDIVAL